MRQTLAVVVLLGATVVPSHSLAQHPAWVTQLEGYLGWRIPLNEVTQVDNGGASATGVELKSTLAYGGRVIFPVANAPTPHLGKVFVGLEGLIAFGADMKVASTDAVIGQADYYQVRAAVGIGKFIGGTPINLTLHGELGVGVAHTVFDPNEGVALVEDGNSGTSLLTSATLGVDFSLARMLSVVTAAGVNLGFRDPLEVSFMFLGGLALRLPTNGGPDY
jgi:hypothetical protein